MAGFRAERPEDLLELRTAYLRALEDGEEELVIDCAFPRAGPPGEPVSGTIELAPADAADLPLLDITLRGARGGTVVSGIPFALAARSVRVENIAFVGAPAPALAITGVKSVTLARVAVLDVTGTAPWPAPALEITASGQEGTSLAVHGLVVAGSGAGAAALNLSGRDGGWFPEIEPDDVTLAEAAAEAALAINGVRRLRADRLRLRSAVALVRMQVPALDAELGDAVLLNAGGIAILEVLTQPPGGAPPLRLVGETLLAAPPAPAEAGALGLSESCRVDGEAAASAIDDLVAAVRDSAGG